MKIPKNPKELASTWETLKPFLTDPNRPTRKQVKEAIEAAIELGFTINSKVVYTLSQGKLTGTIVGYNNSNGFYSGDKYPLKVKRDSNDEVFEESLAMIELQEKKDN